MGFRGLGFSRSSGIHATTLQLLLLPTAMNQNNSNTIEVQRQALLGQPAAAETALNANLELDCASETARVHLLRAHAHIQEAAVTISGLRQARTVWQPLEDLMKGERKVDDLRPKPPVCHLKKSQRI